MSGIKGANAGEKCARYVHGETKTRLHKIWESMIARCEYEYCKVPVYVKTIQYTAPVLAPMTRVEEIRQQLYNLTGEVYLELPKRFCPMCGKELPQTPKGE